MEHSDRTPARQRGGGAEPQAEPLQGAAPQDHRPASAAIRALTKAIHDSPRMTAQRQIMEGLASRRPPRLADRPAAAAPVVQRMLTVRYTAEGLVAVTQTTRRPPDALPDGSQGDHTSPYVVIQAAIANAIAMQRPADAWGSLQETYAGYQTLPGWELSRKGHIARYTAALDAVFTLPVSAENLHQAANLLLALRNGLALTSIARGGGGHGEGGWAGGLQHLETRLQREQEIDAERSDVLINMWSLFDHGRVSAATSAERVALIQQQHALTIVDAYPMVSAHFGITADDVLKELQS